jgi:hypothetical protein
VKQLTPIGVSEVMEWNHKQRFDIAFRMLVLSTQLIYVFQKLANLGVKGAKKLQSFGLLLATHPTLRVLARLVLTAC